KRTNLSPSNSSGPGVRGAGASRRCCPISGICPGTTAGLDLSFPRRQLPDRAGIRWAALGGAALSYLCTLEFAGAANGGSDDRGLAGGSHRADSGADQPALFVQLVWLRFF